MGIVVHPQALRSCDIMSRLPRQSKFRHVFGTEYKKELQFDSLNISSAGTDTNFIKASAKYWAAPWKGGGGAVLVKAHSKPGRCETQPPCLTGHKGEVLDLDFNPFHDDVLATSSEDATVKLWKIPEGGLTDNIDAAQVTLEGHFKKVTLTTFNPVASDVLASTSVDHTVRIWNAEKGVEAQCMEDHPDAVLHLAWDYRGALLGSSCRDKKIRLSDVRSGSVQTAWNAHEGGKAAKVVFLGDTGRAITIGFSKTSERQLYVWDLRDTSKKLHEMQIDQASGVFMPFYDPDTGLLFLGGKGESSIRYYEVVDTAPYVHYLSEFRGKEPQRGLAFMGKRSLDTSICEIARALRLLNNNSMAPVRFEVPRKGGAFQSDLYPDTYAGQPALSADEWMGGANALPRMVAIEASGLGNVSAAARQEDSVATQQRRATAPATPNPLVPSSPAAEARVSELEKENAELKQTIKMLQDEVAGLRAQ